MAGATACGAGDAGDAEDAVADAVRGWMRDVADGNGKSGCARLTAKARRQLVEEIIPWDGRCEGAVFLLSSDLSDEVRDALRRVRVKRVRIRGDRAEVRDTDVEFPARVHQMLEESSPTKVVLRRVDGKWLLEDLG
ncbi:MAG TPA: hypothetical protein VF529_00130 [Solirubrobacteraceae bacterium]